MSVIIYNKISFLPISFFSDQLSFLQLGFKFKKFIGSITFRNWQRLQSSISFIFFLNDILDFHPWLVLVASAEAWL